MRSHANAGESPQRAVAHADAQTTAYEMINQGAAGVDMGRNIFQSEAPLAMIRAVRAVVHENMKPEQAYDLFLDLKRQEANLPSPLMEANNLPSPLRGVNNLPSPLTGEG